MDELSRRNILALGAAASVAGIGPAVAGPSFGNPDEPPQGVINTTGNPASVTIPGPHDDVMSGQFPTSINPPPTDVGALPEFWATFNNAQRRIQNGGWARQVTQESFPISTTISGVDMRLAAGAIREMHWHQAAEWAFVTYGSCRVTVLDPQGRASVADVKEGDLWYFPAGYPHSLQGLGPDGAQFLLCFDDGKQSEYDTLLLNEWFAHTPPDVLALNFGVPAETFSKIPLTDTYIFQSELPGSLAADLAAVKSSAGLPPNPFVFSLGSGPVAKQTKGGMVQIADSDNFKVSKTIAAALVTVHPGGMRELHWHPNADEWQYYIKGAGQMTVFDTGPKAVTTNFHPGDIGYIKRNFGHYIKNVGSNDLVFLEVFRADSYQDIGLSDWLTHTPPQMVTSHLNIPADVIAKFPRASVGVVPV
ncbi:bicupin, oxalate decarboxylase family [Methylocella silvestris BL2]|uniref:Bicupin, oxalate decarboxylase family n=1 Tax=Methylocella silvestris (strain DSM 15510 / CIP 108128 / LMG 27833 / NCIMB 13906 / BL2) TaxID=395965 RepID=B8EQB0_METSB|nr:cupin domain-containing protein [Methylocella silvestris]ACK51600.1 bicupin, oxalate decarboxylase family [Methylocella silvestris BL2]